MGNADRIYPHTNKTYQWPPSTRQHSPRGHLVSENSSFASLAATSMMEAKQSESFVGNDSKKLCEPLGNAFTDGDSPSHPIDISSSPPSRIMSQEPNRGGTTNAMTPIMPQDMLSTIDAVVGHLPVDNPIISAHVMAHSNSRGSSTARDSGSMQQSEQLAAQVSVSPPRRSPRLNKHSNHYKNMMARCTRQLSRHKRHDTSKWYKVHAFTDTRITTDGQLQVLTSFTPVWLYLDDISGSGSKEEIEKLVEAKSGKDEWKKTSQSWICHDLNTPVKLDYLE